MIQAGDYSAVLHYLRAVRALSGAGDPLKVAARMRATPVHDAFTRSGVLRPDGLMVHDMMLVQVKSPAQSRGPWDLYTPVAAIPGKEAFPALAGEGCKLPA